MGRYRATRILDSRRNAQSEGGEMSDELIEAQKRIIELENEVNMKHTHHVVVKLKNELNQANDRIKMLTAAGDIMEPYATEQSAELWAKAKETK
jgi:hypothetical protein